MSDKNPFVKFFKHSEFCEWIDIAIKKFAISSGKHYETIYNSKVVEILSHIDPESKDFIPDFFKFKENKNISIDNVYDIISSQYCDKKYWKKYKDEEEKRMKAQTTLEPNTNIKCNKCGLKKIYTTGIQSRASDEATTQIYNCLNCNHFWKRY